MTDTEYVGPAELVSTLEVKVGGKAYDVLAAPPPCQHLAFTQQLVVARLVDEQTQEFVAWRAQLKIRCGECGVPFRFKHRDDAETPDALTSADSQTLGAIIEPVPENERGDDGWPAVGTTSEAGDWQVSAPKKQPQPLASGD